MMDKKKLPESFGDFLHKILFQFRWLLLLQGLMALIWAIDFSLRPYLIKIILDKALILNTNINISYIFFPTSLYLLIFIISTASYRFYDWILLTRNPEIKKKIISSMIDHLISHSTDFFQNNPAGSLSSRINDVANGLPFILTIAIDKFWGQLLMFIFASIAVFQVGYHFAIALFIWALTFLLGAIVLMQKAKNLSLKSSDGWSLVSGSVVDTLANIANVRFFVGRKQENNNFTELLNSAMKTEREASWFLLNMYIFQNIVFFYFKAYVCFGLLPE